MIEKHWERNRKREREKATKIIRESERVVVEKDR